MIVNLFSDAYDDDDYLIFVYWMMMTMIYDDGDAVGRLVCTRWPFPRQLRFFLELHFLLQYWLYSFLYISLYEKNRARGDRATPRSYMTLIHLHLYTYTIDTLESIPELTRRIFTRNERKVMKQVMINNTTLSLLYCLTLAFDEFSAAQFLEGDCSRRLKQYIHELYVKKVITHE